jgi:hypothetical protein
MRYMENSISGHMQIGFIVDQYGWKSDLADKSFVFYIEFKQNPRNSYGIHGTVHLSLS